VPEPSASSGPLQALVAESFVRLEREQAGRDRSLVA
jgi:hypothetical protein